MTEMFEKRGFSSIDMLCKAFFVKRVNLIKALTYDMEASENHLDCFT